MQAILIVLIVLSSAICAEAKSKSKHKHMALKDDLVLHLNFQQNPFLFPPLWDQSLNENHFRPNNFTVDSQGITTGKLGDALLFNGGNQSLTLIKSYTRISHEGNSFTVGFWIKFVSFSDGASIVVGPEWSVTLLEISPDFFLTATIDSKGMTVNVPLVLGRWYYVVFGYEAEGGGRIFAGLNPGEPDAVGVHNLHTMSGALNGSFVIGGNGSYMVLDEFSIWRRNLSDVELYTLYNKGNGLAFLEWDKVRVCKEIKCCDD